MTKRLFKFTLPAILLFVLVGCATYTPAPVSSVGGYQNGSRGEYRGSYYKVKTGDTLYFISYLTDKNVNDLIAYNGLTPPYTIYPGQRLNLWGASYQAPQYGKRVEPVGSSVKSSNVSVNSSTVTAAAKTANASVSKASTATTVVGSSIPEIKPLTENSLKNSKNEQNSDITKNKSDVVKKDPVNSIEPSQSNGYGKLISKNDVNKNNISKNISSNKNKNIVEAKSTEIKKVEGWLWPTKGRVIEKFSTGDQGNKGIDIAGQRGQAIVATANGSVVYSGNALRGYGNLIIIKHNDNYLSAYAHNDRLLVEEGQNVTAGQKIATMGSTGTSSVRLHFEIRYQGKSMNPSRYLP